MQIIKAGFAIFLLNGLSPLAQSQDNANNSTASWSIQDINIQGQTSDSAIKFNISQDKGPFGCTINIPILKQDDNTNLGTLTRPFNSVSVSPFWDLKLTENATGYCSRLEFGLPIGASQYKWTDINGKNPRTATKVNYGASVTYQFAFLPPSGAMEGSLTFSRLYLWKPASAVNVVTPQNSGPALAITRTISGPSSTPATTGVLQINGKLTDFSIGLGVNLGKVWSTTQDITRPEFWVYWYPTAVKPANSRIGLAIYQTTYSDTTPTDTGLLINALLSHKWWK